MTNELQELCNAAEVAARMLEAVTARLAQLEAHLTRDVSPGPGAYLKGPRDPEYIKDRQAIEHRDAITPNVPEGYDTVLGYLAKYHPDVLDHVDYENPEVTVRDGYKLAHWCRLGGHPEVYVDAPPCLRRQGINKVRAYPVSLLAQRWG